MKEFTVRIRNTVNGLDISRSCFAENTEAAESEIKTEIEAKKHAWRILEISESSDAPALPQSPPTESNAYPTKTERSYAPAFQWGCLCLTAVAVAGIYGFLSFESWYLFKFLIFYAPFAVVLGVLGGFLVLTGKK